MTLQDKDGKVLYQGAKKQYDSFSWKTETEGTYKVLSHSVKLQNQLNYIKLSLPYRKFTVT